MSRLDDRWTDICPRCQNAYLRATTRPFMRVFRGHLFTIPRARVYICDLCTYYEYEDAAVEMISHMFFGAVNPDQHDGKTSSLPFSIDDEGNNQNQQSSRS